MVEQGVAAGSGAVQSCLAAALFGDRGAELLLVFAFLPAVCGLGTFAEAVFALCCWLSGKLE